LDIDFIVRFTMVLIMLIVIFRIYMFVARYVGEHIRRFFVNIWNQLNRK